MANIVDDNFIKQDDDYNKYVEFIRLIFNDYCKVVDVFDNIIENGIFTNETYIELSGVIKYASKRVFPLLLAFFDQDENFSEDIYPEFMDIQLMVLYLYDKLQYELDEVIIKWELNDAEIKKDLIDLETVNYLIKVIMEQLDLFAKVFDIKIQVIEGSISETEYERKLVEIHDAIFI